MTLKIDLRILLLGLMIWLTSGCKVYRFTDASIDPKIKSVSVQTFPNLASIQVPVLSELFTTRLKNKFLRESNLVLVSNGGDVDFSGSIVNYSIDPASVTNTETVAQNRLTIVVKVDCFNKIDPTKSYSQVFSENEVYASSEDISTVENQLIQLITDKLVQNIFNRTFSNW